MSVPLLSAPWSHYPSSDRIFGESSSLYNNLRLNATSSSVVAANGLENSLTTALPFQNGHFFASPHHSTGHNHHHLHNMNHLHPNASTQMAAMFPDSTSTHLHPLHAHHHHHPEQILSYHYHNHHSNAATTFR